jgi:hypothetical protein
MVVWNVEEQRSSADGNEKIGSSICKREEKALGRAVETSRPIRSIESTCAVDNGSEAS